MWAEWKIGQFENLVTTEMEMTAQGLYKKLNKLSRELKVGNQIVISKLHHLKIDNFLFRINNGRLLTHQRTRLINSNEPCLSSLT